MMPFDRLLEAFRQAADRNGLDGDLQAAFGGARVRIRVVGNLCAERITAPFRHLVESASTGDDPELAIEVFDAHESKTDDDVSGRNDPPDPGEASSEFGSILGTADSRFIGCHRPGMLTWIDREKRHIVSRVADSRRLHPYEIGKPLLFPLIQWYLDRGAYVIHGALVEADGRGVLLAGPGGSGKSTAAMACVEAGFRYLGDDYIALEDGGSSRFIGHSLFNTAWFDSDLARRFPKIAANLEEGASPKKPVLLHKLYPDRLGRSAEVSYLVVPKISGDTGGQLTPASAKLGLLALAPTSIMKRLGRRRRGFDLIGRMLEEVPVFVLELGADVRQVAAGVRKLTDRGV